MQCAASLDKNRRVSRVRAENEVHTHCLAGKLDYVEE